MMTLAFAPLGGWAFAPVLVVPVLTLCLYAPPRTAARYAFWFGVGLFLFGTYWVYISIYVFGQAPLWLSLVLMLGLVLIMALWYAATGWLVAVLSRGSPARLVLAAPAAWVLVEWFRGWFLTGFPWLSLGYSQIDSPLAGWLPVLGVYGVSFLIVLSASAFVASLAFTGRPRQLVLALAVVPWLAGFGLQWVTWSRPSGDALTATIVQGGIPQERKHLPEQFRPTLDLYGKTIASHPGSDLIVWPEVAIPATARQVEPYVAALERELGRRGQSLVLGILDAEGQEIIYNSVFLLDGDSRQVYRKRHLVPFGEYFPVPDLLRHWLAGMINLPSGDISAGEEQQPLLALPGGTELATAICYEDAYGAEQLYALPEAGLLINVSNDAWFGDSIAPHQHLEIARARAAEAARYAIRATNNGVSAFIGPGGELLQTAPQFRYATLTMDVVPRQGATPFVRVGNWPVITFSLAVMLFLALKRRL